MGLAAFALTSPLITCLIVPLLVPISYTPLPISILLGFQILLPHLSLYLPRLTRSLCIFALYPYYLHLMTN